LANKGVMTGIAKTNLVFGDKRNVKDQIVMAYMLL